MLVPKCIAIVRKMVNVTIMDMFRRVLMTIIFHCWERFAYGDYTEIKGTSLNFSCLGFSWLLHSRLSLLGTVVALSVRRRAHFRKDSFACFKTSDSQLQRFRAVWVWSSGAASTGLLLRPVSQAEVELVWWALLKDVQEGAVQPLQILWKRIWFWRLF